MLRIITAAALLAIAVTTTAAQAADTEIVSTTVPYGDLNLSSPTDAKILADRLQAAAKTVCADTKDATVDCQTTAISGAIASIEDHMEHNVRAHLDVVQQNALQNP